MTGQTAAGMVGPLATRPLRDLNHAQLDQLWQAMIDVASRIAKLQTEAAARASKGGLVLVCVDGVRIAPDPRPRRARKAPAAG